MAVFFPPFDWQSVQRINDVTITLPDPYDPATSSITPDDPITRPGIARYAALPLMLLHVQSSTSSAFTLAAPVSGTVRLISLGTSVAGQLNNTPTLLEIEVLPFGVASTLQRLKGGVPTFYIGYNSPAVTWQEFDFVNAGEQLAVVNGDAYVGLCFQDGTTLAPWEWIGMLGRALAEEGDSAGASTWNELSNLYGGLNRIVRVLDHRGQPVGPNQNFSVSTNGGPASPLVTDANSALVLAPGNIMLNWQGEPPAGDAPLPVHALYSELVWTADDDALSTPPGNSILIPAGLRRGHLQVLDLSSWFSQRPPAPPDPAIPTLPRFHTNSRVEPLVDGIDCFRLIVEDLLATAAPGYGGHFSGLIFNDFEMVPALDLSSDNMPEDTSIVELSKFIRQHGGDVRMMFDKFVRLKDGVSFGNNLQLAIMGTLLVGISLAGTLAVLEKLPTDLVGYALLSSGSLLGAAVAGKLLTGPTTIGYLESIIEPSIELFEVLNAPDEADPGKPMLAVWGRHPARMADNPLANLDFVEPLNTLLGVAVADIQDRFGSWHQKIQAIKRAAPGNPVQAFYVGYAGGIDINRNRLDSAGHQSKSPYHDAHARVTGSAAWDIHQTWLERYAFETQQYSQADNITLPPPAFTVAPPSVDPAAYPPQAAKHIVQLGRTYFRPTPGSGTTPLAFAPNGEQTTYDTYLRAMKQAREYIYMEDQYFTPNSAPTSQNAGNGGPGDPEVLLDVLLNASNHCKRLVVMMPREGDQPFGQHRRGYVISLLRDRWQERLFVGVPLRRPLLPPPGRIASKGRALLLEAINNTDTSIKVGPVTRLPGEAPFWLWIYGELMLCTKVSSPILVGNVPAKSLTVVRGPNLSGTDPRWGAFPCAHKAGAPVTFSQLRGPYVHAKVMLVDDIFAAIGSSNVNRRGYFHDGELHVFTVPEQLKAAPENPALALRTALWAEHLGIPPAMGFTLLADPLAAYELFRRGRYQGNRSVPVNAINEVPHLGGEVGDSVTSALSNLAQVSLALYLNDVWNTLSDPTTIGDPRPTEGPFT